MSLISRQSLGMSRARFVFLAVLLGLAACARQEVPIAQRGGGQGGKAEVVIGSYMPVTGPAGGFGESCVEGMKLSVERINADGGVLGRRIRLLVEDDAGNPEVAKNAVEKLVEREEALVIVGGIPSKCSLAAADICQNRKIPMVSPASTSLEVTKKGDYIFRVCFTDDFQGWACAGLAHQLGFRRAAVLRDKSNAYSIGLAERFMDVFQRLEGTIVEVQDFQEGDKDFNAQLSKIKGADPDVIFIPAYYTEVGGIAIQARQQGISQTLMGGDGWDSPKLLEIAGQAVEGGFFTVHSYSGVEEPVMQEFAAIYRQKYGKEPDSLACLGYDAVGMVADAISRAGSAEPIAIRDALAQTQGFQGATGTITIDEQRNAKKAAYALVIKGGRPVFYKKIEPEVATLPSPSTGEAPDGSP